MSKPDSNQRRPATPEQPVFEGAPVLIYVAPPVGWIAMLASELEAATVRAAELLPPRLSEEAVSPGMPANPGRTLLTAAEAATALSVRQSWLLREAREGRIAHVRLGKYVRFDLDAIVGQCTKHPRTRRDTRIA